MLILDFIQTFGLQADFIPISPVIDHTLIQMSGLETASLKRKREFCSGRMAGRNALARINIKGDLIPRLKNGIPLWPEGSCGSLSHSDTHACAVVANSNDYLGVGVDLESISSTKQLSRLRTQFLRTEEKELTAYQALVAFSAKEALFKMLFPMTQEYFGFHSAQVICFSKNAVTLLLTQDVGAFSRGSEFRVLHGIESEHVMTVACLGCEAMTQGTRRSAGN